MGEIQTEFVSNVGSYLLVLCFGKNDKLTNTEKLVYANAF